MRRQNGGGGDRHSYLDGVCLLAAAAVAACIAALPLPMLDGSILTPDVGHRWFGADTARVYENMTDRRSNHYRAKVHPLFSLATFPVIQALRLTGLTSPSAVYVWLLATGALWGATLFVLLRCTSCGPALALLFAALGSVSGAYLFFAGIPEVYLLGSLGMMFAMIVVAVAERRPTPDSWLMMASVCTLSITLTNWWAGIVATFALRPWRNAMQICVNGFAAVTLLWGVQKGIFPTAEFFLGDREEVHYVVGLKPLMGDPESAHYTASESSRIANVLRSFMVHTIVLPRIETRQVSEPGASESSRMMSVQFAGVAAEPTIANAGVILWLVLLGAGGASVVRERSPLRSVLLLTLGGQLVLHLVYGSETFLYSLHWAPLLIVVAAHALRSHPAMRVVLAIALLLLTSVHNVQEFRSAIARYNAW